MRLLSAVVAWSLRHRAIVILATLILALGGVRAALTLPIDAVPDVTNVQVQIITSAPALSPIEAEQYVTVPVERAMSGIPRTTEVRSISKYGLSVVTVVFEDGTDIYFARQLVNERIREAEQSVPSQFGTPELGPISSGLGEIFQFVVKNDDLDVMEIEELLDWQIAPELRSVPGVIEVNSFGSHDKEYQVVLDPRRLEAARVSVTEVVEAIERSNGNAGGGYLEHEREHFVIGTDGIIKDREDLERVVIGATPEGVPITVAMVGDVVRGTRLRHGAASMNGDGEVVIGVALMLLGENSRTVTAAVKAKLAAIQSSLPPGTRVEPFYDRAALVDRTITTVGTNLVEGALLVIAVLFLLLGDFRAGLVVAVTIPLSMLFALIVMKLTGVSGNLMSLGAVDFGLLVDGAVIIVENSVRALSERQAALERPLTPEERTDIVRTATLEVQAAAVFGVAIIAIVYLPVVSLTGIEGKMFRPMATTVLCALAGAFILSLTLVPALTSLFVRPKRGAHDTFLLRQIRRLYVPALAAAMRARPVMIGAGVLALAGTVLLFGRLGAEFVPVLDEGDLLIEARRIPGIALSESVATDMRLEKAVLAIPEVSGVVARVGAPEVATDPMGVEQSDVYVLLKPRKDWRDGLTKDALAKEVGAAAEEAVPEIASGVSQPIQMRTNELVAGVRSDVAVLLYGADLEVLAALGDKVVRSLASVKGAVDVRAEQVAGLRYLRVIPDRNKLARYGLSVSDVNRLTETLAVGSPAGELLEGERRFGIVVKMKHDFAGDLEPLLALPLRSSTGQVVPLGDVAKLAFQPGPAVVSRESLSRRLTVEFNVRGRDLLSVVEDAQAAIGRDVKLPTGYRAVWGGQFEHYVEAKSRLTIVIPLALGMIAFLLWMAFQSGRAAALIFLNVPFAVIGGVVALWARDIPFSISAGVGFIALFGVAVLNGLVLVSFARQLEATGLDHVAAIRRAADLRLRPVLMTALVAALGFVPMALSTAPGSEVQRPLATVVIGGLATATLLTMLLLPVVYSYLGAPRRVVRALAKGQGASGP
ncbi:MAG: efflux RND transporter permease subunit [Polyangiaceae bacterium]|nr:efflux RND transporter permease subunit [Polyangiaceae bacterium]